MTKLSLNQFEEVLKKAADRMSAQDDTIAAQAAEIERMNTINHDLGEHSAKLEGKIERLKEALQRAADAIINEDLSFSEIAYERNLCIRLLVELDKVTK